MMHKHLAVQKMEQEYTPELKLRVVLEYIRMPRQRRHICKENQISEELLDEWHQEFLARASQIFADPRPAPQIRPPDREPEPRETSRNEAIPLSQSHWGIRLNHGWQESQALSRSKDPPAWRRGFYLSDWKSKRGIVVWDDAAQKIEVLSATEALSLLEKLRKSDEWRIKGIPITQRVTRLKLSSIPKQKRSRKKQTPGEPVIADGRPDQEEVEVEQFRLKREAGDEVFAFLEERQNLLKQMAEDDEEYRKKLLGQVYTMILGWTREEGRDKPDLAKRPDK